MNILNVKYELLTLVIISILIFISCDDSEKENFVPICKITSPITGEKFEQGDIVDIYVYAYDEDDEIVEVCFYIDNVKVSSSAYPYNYKWITTTDVEPGNHTIKAEAEDSRGEIVISEIQISIIEITNPITDFICDQTEIKQFQGIQFKDKSSPSIKSWFWEFGDGLTSTEQNPFHIYDNGGSYSVSLTVTNVSGSDTEYKTDYIKVNNHELGTVEDYDGNIYSTVKIGDQWWMRENLKTTHYTDGTEIELVENDSIWDSLSPSVKAMCYYDNSQSFAEIYGALYTWAAAMNGANSSSNNPSNVQGACPDGWHLPSDSEWTQLTKYLGGINNAGGKMKAVDTGYWRNPNNGATNESGFTALPGGNRMYYGNFAAEGNVAFFWTSTEYFYETAWFRYLNSAYSEIFMTNYYKYYGYSVRCVKD